jgi:hypothetical protein
MNSPIHQVLLLLHNSLAQLGKNIDWASTEPIGTTIFLAMEGNRRKFHTTQHLLDVCRDMNPTQTLAGLFHDVVYVQIDGGFPPQTEKILAQYVHLNPQNLEVTISQNHIENPLFELVLQLFGFAHGQKLSPFAGQNEFLSALLCAELLHPYLTVTELLAVLACIEATIPFRKENAAGQSCYEVLEQRIREITKMVGLPLSNTAIDDIVKDAVMLGNRDVANFAFEDVGRFLDNTWILLPESNFVMWQGGVYSVVSYRNALLKMETFLGFLNPKYIFHSYKNTPNIVQFEELVQKATYNVSIATQYIGMKLLPVAVIEALALLTGGDAPLSMFVGDVRVYNTKIQRAEDFLPQNNVQSPDLQVDIVYQLLAVGRTSPTSFDLQNSPLAAYLYANLSANARVNLLTQAKAFFKQEISPKEFLQYLPKDLLVNLVVAVSQIALSRKNILKKLLDELR